VDIIMEFISSRVRADANIIFGSTFDESLAGGVQVSLIVTGTDIIDVDAPAPKSARPKASGTQSEEGGGKGKGGESGDGEGSEGGFFSKFKIF
jgi:cell division protein FtsZ